MSQTFTMSTIKRKYIPVGLDDGSTSKQRSEQEDRQQRAFQKLLDRDGGHKGNMKSEYEDDNDIDYSASGPPNIDTMITPVPCTSTGNHLTRIHGDMTMRVSAHGVRTLVREFVKEHLFRLVKFFNKDMHGHYDLSRASVCGLVIHHCNVEIQDANAAWWATMRKTIVTTLTNHRNNVIKTVRAKYRGTSKTYMN
jgi:hypothetical protein